MFRRTVYCVKLERTRPRVDQIMFGFCGNNNGVITLYFRTHAIDPDFSLATFYAEELISCSGAALPENLELFQASWADPA